MELKVAMGRFHDDRGGAAEEDLKILLNWMGTRTTANSCF